MNREMSLESMFQVDHIGVAVKDIEAAQKHYAALGFTEVRGDIKADENQRIRARFLQNGDTILELLEPLYQNDEKCPLKPFLKGMNFHMYHICYRVNDIHQALAFLKKERYTAICAPVPGPVFRNQLIAFAFHAKMGLVELVETEF